MPQRSGSFALVAILEPYIVLTALLVVPLALVGRTRLGALIAVVIIVTVIARYGSGFVSGPVGDVAPTLTVTAWNVEAGDNGAQRVVDGLAGVSSDLIGLEELQPEMADAVSTDPLLADAYPYRALSPDGSVLGVGLLSRYPILEQSFSESERPRRTAAAPFMRALVALPNGPPTAVYVVHPLPGRFRSVLGVTIGIDTTDRDAGIATIRAAIAADLAAHTPVIVMGDINTTPREPGYGDLSAGLNDARSAGSWPGLTWRWDLFKSLPFGLLRIDYVFTTEQPVSYGVRCTALSDHCLVSAALAFRQPSI